MPTEHAEIFNNTLGYAKATVYNRHKVHQENTQVPKEAIFTLKKV